MGFANETDALKLASIAHRRRFDGYTLVEVPSRRDFYFGNALALDRAPGPNDLTRWIDLHAEHFAGTGIRRHAFVWERSAVGEPAKAFDNRIAGDVARSIVFVRRTPLPAVDVSGVYELAADCDWDEAAELDAGEYTPEFADFERWQFGVVRADARAGRMRMWGLRRAGKLVAFAGAYAGSGVARFATPVTDRAFRGRGAFRTLCSVVVGETLARDPGATIVILARAGEAPEAIYGALGFDAVGEQIGLTRDLIYS